MIDAAHTRSTQGTAADLADQRAEFRELTRRIAAYRHSGIEPPEPLERQRRALLVHFAAISQGR